MKGEKLWLLPIYRAEVSTEEICHHIHMLRMRILSHMLIMQCHLHIRMTTRIHQLFHIAC